MNNIVPGVGEPVTGYHCVVCLRNAQVLMSANTFCVEHFKQWNGGYHGTKSIQQLIEEYKKQNG